MAAIPPFGLAEPPAPEKATLSRYAVLWESPLFALPATSEGEEEPEPREADSETANLRLAGWGETSDSEIAVAFNCNTLETFVLDSSHDSSEGPMHLLKLERGDARQAARALVEWNGRTFWIHTAQPGAEASFTPANLVVDSRSARVHAPVLFTKDATMDDWTGDANSRKSGQSRMQELRDRHRRLQELFGR
jgi:hypothetical protein